MALRAAPLLAAAAAAGLLVTGGGSAGASGGAAPVYSALASEGPTGLTLVSGHHLHMAGEAAAPSFPAQPPAGAENWPVASSIRRLALSDSSMSAWIARSSEGGVCVLVYDGVPVDGVAAVYAGCSSAEALTRGASVEIDEIPGMPGETIAAGVVPDGVTGVSERLADGSTATSAVSGNAWLRVGSEPAAPDEQPTEITGG